MNAHSAKSDATHTLAVLEAMIRKHDSLPSASELLSEKILDQSIVDLEGFFTRVGNDVIVFAKGKFKGARLDLIAATSEGRSYLDWMLNQPLLPDTHHYVRQAMRKT